MAWADQPPPQTTEVRRVNLAAENLFDAVKTPAAGGHAAMRGGGDGGGGGGGEGSPRMGTGGGRSPAPEVERRSAALVLRLAEIRGWMQDVLRLELPPGDLPALLADGELLMSLADTAMPGVGAPYAGSLPSRKFEAFATACRQLGVPESEILQESWLVGPQRSAELVVRGVEALAREASARRLLPPLSS